MVRTIRLFGHLGETFGQVHRLNVSSPAEAIRALCANFPNFRKYMIDSEKYKVGYRVKNGSFEVDAGRVRDEIREPASGEIHITPAVIGAGPVARIIIGAVLVVAAIVLAPYTDGFSLQLLQVAGAMGASLALGGIVQLLSPSPKAGDPSERPDNKPSYLFNGPVNTSAQGQPVPIGYGRLTVGGAVISAGITLEQLKQGFKRVKTIETRANVFRWLAGNVEYAASGLQLPPFLTPVATGEPPKNWYKRTQTDVYPAFGGGTIFKFTYYYYVWTLVPL